MSQSEHKLNETVASIHLQENEDLQALKQKLIEEGMEHLRLKFINDPNLDVTDSKVTQSAIYRGQVIRKDKVDPSLLP